MSPPRIPATSGFTSLDASEKIEEESFPWYSPSTFYPVRIGEVFRTRYQALAKLGYGSSATVWLGRDLVEHRYVALKVCVRDYPSILREKSAYERLRSVRDSPFVQKCWDTFKIDGIGDASHECLVLEPLSISLAALGARMRGWADIPSFRATARQVVEALRFLHEEAHLIHCDLRKENFLCGVSKDRVFREIEEHENREPSPRKIDGDRVIHTSRHITIIADLTGVVLSDLGEARAGDTPDVYYDDIQPFPYRAPEVILEVPFSYPVDIWNVGVMLWHMFERKPLFHPYLPDGEAQMVHLAEMVAVMGPPPPAFLSRVRSPTYVRWNYFDASGKWTGVIPVPSDMSLESRETRLAGEEQAEFLRFIRRCLQWEPEKRATAAELCQDPWLNVTAPS
ncbi:kinase-like protein [Gloeophyllum trabeum ATCC 11539]|uniref:Kinase-like protein n=1 Tax=Gloeophyllum trabeum (strain ATCC 11539 / FP-39264 / Madison 617) TaxID=670483 RepID=S7QEH9_GLOTA|nr:kinase-like protein [Gloeophyllum trabeum ATCC 11539]EPQ57713.1 kinase-like protein [Gloeophyllum trabeum ATCC 11539]